MMLLLNKLVLHALDIRTVKKSPLAQNALKDVLQSVNGTDEYIELVNRYEVKSENQNLLKLSVEDPINLLEEMPQACYFNLGGSNLIWNVINGKDTAQQNSLLAALAGVGSKESIDILQTLLYPINMQCL